MLPFGCMPHHHAAASYHCMTPQPPTLLCPLRLTACLPGWCCPCLLVCLSVCAQHGERAVRTAFAPLGFMPLTLPDAPPAADAAGDSPSSSGAAAADADAAAEEEAGGPVDRVPEYPDAPEGSSSVVTLVFPEAVCPERLVFVLHQLGPDAWVRDHGE